MSLLCDCQLQEGNGFLNESLALYSFVDKLDRNMYFTVNTPFAYLMQMTFPEAVLPEDFISQLTNYKFSFPVTLQDFVDHNNSLYSLAKDQNF